MSFVSLLFTNRSLKQIILKNTFWLMVSQGTSRVLKFFLLVFAARELGPTNYGAFIYIFALVGLYFALGDLGLGAFLIREYHTKNRSELLLSTLFYLRVIILTIFTIAGYFFYFTLQDPALQAIYFIVLAVYVGIELKTFFVTLGRANNRVELDSMVSVVETVVTCVMGYIALKYWHSLPLFSAAYLAAAIIALILQVKLTYRLLLPLSAFNLAYTRQIFLTSLPFVYTSLIGITTSQIDIVSLKYFIGIEAVGLFSVGSRVVQLGMMLPSLLLTTLFPVFASLTADRTRVASLIRTSLSLILLFGFPLAIWGIASGPAFILFLYGAEYSAGSAAFQVLMLVIPLIFIINVLDHALMALNYQMQNMAYTTIAVVLNIILNVILIPRIGLVGASLASVIANIVNLFLTLALSKHVLGGGFIDFNILARYALLSVASGGILFFLLGMHTPLILAYSVATMIYISALALLKDSTFYLLTSTALQTMNRIRRMDA